MHPCIKNKNNLQPRPNINHKPLRQFNSPSDVLLRANDPGGTIAGARHWRDEHVSLDEREGVHHGEKGEDEREDRELHDGVHDRGRRR